METDKQSIPSHPENPPSSPAGNGGNDEPSTDDSQTTGRAYSTPLISSEAEQVSTSDRDDPPRVEAASSDEHIKSLSPASGEAEGVSSPSASERAPFPAPETIPSDVTSEPSFGGEDTFSSPSELEEKVELIAEENRTETESLILGTKIVIEGAPYTIRSKAGEDPEGFYEYYEVVSVNEGRTYWLWKPRHPDTAWRLRREAALLGQVRSPFLPELIAYRDGDDPLLLTEPLPPILSMTEGQSLSMDSFLGILAQLAQALEALHRSGWIHRALRPGVIRKGRSLILTGFSRAVRKGEHPQENFYFEGFTAPESLKLPCDERMDIYGVGALLYWYLRNKPIETGSDPLLESWEPGLLQVITHLLGTPTERWSSMRQVHRALLALRARQRPGWAYETGSATTIGMDPARTTNQDASGYLQSTLNGERGRQTWGIFIIADGMGGMEGGDIASYAAVGAFLEKAQAIPSVLAAHHDPGEYLRTLMQAANAAVWEALHAETLQGGTTALAILLVENLLWAVHIGDCRLYLLREGKISCLTEDHSLAALQLKRQNGYADPELLRTHPERSRLLRSLGERHSLPDGYIDTLRQGFSLPLTLKAGDTLLLATDGLWEPLSTTDLQKILSQPAPSPYLARHLVQEALSKNTSDNATAIVIRVHETYQT